MPGSGAAGAIGRTRTAQTFSQREDEARSIETRFDVLCPANNPVLRPIGREYQEIVELLARGKRRGVPKRLSRLEQIRQQLIARMTEIDDYLNWFEATQMNSGSGTSPVISKLWINRKCRLRAGTIRSQFTWMRWRISLKIRTPLMSF